MPGQALGHQEGRDGAVERAAHAVGRAGAAFVAQHLEDREVGIALDQRQHRRGGVVQRAAEVVVRCLLQRARHVVHALAPALRQLLARQQVQLLGGALQLGDVDQRAAVEQRLQLRAAAHRLAARQQQRAVCVADVEGQRFTNTDAVLHGRQRGQLHGGRALVVVRCRAGPGATARRQERRRHCQHFGPCQQNLTVPLGEAPEAAERAADLSCRHVSSARFCRRRPPCRAARGPALARAARLQHRPRLQRALGAHRPHRHPLGGRVRRTRHPELPRARRAGAAAGRGAATAWACSAATAWPS